MKRMKYIVRLGLAPTAGSQNRCRPVGLGCSIHLFSARTRTWPYQDNHSTLWHICDLGLEAGLVVDLKELPY